MGITGENPNYFRKWEWELLEKVGMGITWESGNGNYLRKWEWEFLEKMGITWDNGNYLR